MKAGIHRYLITAAIALAAGSANALSISATPASQSNPGSGQVVLNLSMSFETQSVGGGIIFDFSGPISFVSFTPSAYFTSLNTDAAGDTDFTGFGTSNKPASAEYELHFGSFSGVGGNNDLGTMTFNVSGTGAALVDLSISPGNYYGGFLDLLGNPQSVTLNDAQLTAAPIPLPATAWLFLSCIGATLARARRRA